MNERGAVVEGYWQGKVEALQESNRPNVSFHHNSHMLSQKKKCNQIAKGALQHRFGPSHSHECNRNIFYAFRV